MLFVLTGQIQTGKTRWLENVVNELQRKGMTPCGVLAPGVWADRRNDPARFPHADANGFEKLGIDNVLLPSGERIAFARRADLASQEGSYNPNSQSGQAKLGWHISDDAIARVNEHFATLRASSGQTCEQERNDSPAPGEALVGSLQRQGGNSAACSGGVRHRNVQELDRRAAAGRIPSLPLERIDQRFPSFLIIDELGQLELVRGGGLTQAVALLEDGPTTTMRHVLIVVREALLPHLEGRFGKWGEVAHVRPDAPSRALILEHVGNALDNRQQPE